MYTALKYINTGPAMLEPLMRTLPLGNVLNQGRVETSTQSAQGSERQKKTDPTMSFLPVGDGNFSRGTESGGWHENT